MEDRIQLLSDSATERLKAGTLLAAMRRATLTEMMLALGVTLLLGSLLFQAPLLELRISSASRPGILLHSWNFAWVLFAGILGGVLLTNRAAASGAVAAVRQSVHGDPILALAAATIFACMSLSWVYLTFGGSGFAGAVERVLELAGVLVLAIGARCLIGDRLRTALVVVFIGLAVVSAAWAFGAWRWQTFVLDTGAHPLTLHVSRAGGPYGNQFASPGAPIYDHWWVPSGAANGLGFILAVAVSVTAAYLLRSFRRVAPRVVVLAGGATLILVAGLVATQSRESWLAAVVATGIALWPGRRDMASRSRLAACATVSLGIVALVVAIPTVRHRISDSVTPGTFSYRTGPQARVDAWKEGVHWGLERFPIGWGVGTVEEHPDLFGRSTAENVYLQYFAQLGLVGLLAVAAMSINGLRLGYRAAKGTPSLPTLYALAFFAALIVHGQFGNTLGDPTILIGLGLALAFCVPKRQGNTPAGGW
jgi:hypothetical protein